jgi:Amt family ammonium transporter
MAQAQDAPAAPPTIAEIATKLDEGAKSSAFVANTVWTLIAGMLVFFMNAGFGCLEAGLCRRKNAVHILAKNFIVFAVASIAFWAIGFGMMFGKSVIGGTDGAAGFLGWASMFPTLLDGTDGDYPGIAWALVPASVKFFFQLVFAGTAATIVSGAVAERTKFNAFMIFSFILIACVYPVTGHWIWGGGWLAAGQSYADMKAVFHDFAGSTVVHSVGGWAALAGVIVVGKRIGKYGPDGKVSAIPGHNMGLAALGCLILWLGWFGFNPGSTMTAGAQIGYIAVTTNTAAAFGAVAATITAWLVLGKPDLSMILNGCLAGLVGITAGCAVVTVGGAAIIGLIAGVLVVFAVLMFDKLKLDDPVGALSVHLVCGVLGTLCVGLFANKAVIEAYGMTAYCLPGLFSEGGNATQLLAQIKGVLAVGGVVFPLSLVTWFVLKLLIGVRVSAQEEIEGLDVGEHGMEAYPGFAIEAADIAAGPTEPRAATTPRDGKKRYSVVIEGVDGQKLIDAWSGLCHAKATPSNEFKQVYPYFSTVSGNKFRFTGGDPTVISENITRLFKTTLGSDGIRSKVES